MQQALLLLLLRPSSTTASRRSGTTCRHHLTYDNFGSSAGHLLVVKVSSLVGDVIAQSSPRRAHRCACQRAGLGGVLGCRLFLRAASATDRMGACISCLISETCAQRSTLRRAYRAGQAA